MRAMLPRGGGRRHNHESSMDSFRTGTQPSKPLLAAEELPDCCRLPPRKALGVVIFLLEKGMHCPHRGFARIGALFIPTHSAISL
jgi:hypothetical protein